jgi:filamentous hemagglutinin family protein
MKNNQQPCPPFALQALAIALVLSFAATAQAGPVGGVVAAGAAAISSSGTATTITQSSANTVINWQSFGIAAGESVRFAQPGSSSVALNRVVGADASAIFGSLSSNGKVFLVNPNGILFGRGSSVNVGGLVASTLNISDANFMTGKFSFAGPGKGAIINEGTIDASGGYVALLGSQVTNQGVISARMGMVALAAGSAITLDVMGDKLLNVTVDEAVVDALVQNGSLIQADGGHVLLTTQAAGSLLASVVNNTGVIQAQTISTRNGVIKLMGGMQAGTVDVDGTLDASAPHGGNGGFIETSAAHVKVRDTARITTGAAQGQTGTWLIDPQDFVIGGGATDNISGATLSALLVTNSVTITTQTGPDATVAGTPPVTTRNTATTGNGDIHVNQAVSWTGSTSATTLTLNAERDVNVNQAVTATNGNFVVCCGRDVNVSAAVTTTNGSVLLSAGRNLNVNPAGAMSTTDGNITMCAAVDVNIGAKITLTRGSSIPSQSLGLTQGLVLSAGTGGTGPGIAGGTVIFAPLAPKAVVTGPNAPVTVTYNPVSYALPSDYSTKFDLTLGAALTQRMLVFGVGDKTADGSTSTTLTSLKGSPTGVTLVAGPGSAANFDSADAGTNKVITSTGYTLGGPNAANFALAQSCCGPAVAKTSGTIVAAAPSPTPAPTPSPTPGLPVPLPEVTGSADLVVPRFAPFVVAPVLLGSPMVLVVAPVAPAPPVALVTVERELAPTPDLVTVPAPAVAPAPASAPIAAPIRAPKPFRN